MHLHVCRVAVARLGALAVHEILLLDECHLRMIMAAGQSYESMDYLPVLLAMVLALVSGAAVRSLFLDYLVAQFFLFVH